MTKSQCCDAETRWLDCADCEKSGETCPVMVCVACGAETYTDPRLRPNYEWDIFEAEAEWVESMNNMKDRLSNLETDPTDNYWETT